MDFVTIGLEKPWSYKHNRTSITQALGFTFQTYPKPRVLLNKNNPNNPNKFTR